MAFAKGENPHRPRKGDSIRVEPIRSKKHIANIKKILADKPRDLCLFTLGINTAFRANELLSIKVGEVRYLGVGDTLTLKQRKTQKYRSVVLNDNVVESIKNHLREASLSDEAALFTGLRGCLTVPTVNRLVKTWCASVGLKGNYGSHSMRKTWGTGNAKMAPISSIWSRPLAMPRSVKPWLTWASNPKMS
jgi:integrase